MRKILTALVAAAAFAGFAGTAFAGGGCGGGYHASSKVGSEIASTGGTTKPVQQTQAPTGSSQ